MKSALFISHEFPPMVGGAGVVCENTTNLLFRLGWDIRIITTRVKNRPTQLIPLSECHNIRHFQPLFFYLIFLRWRKSYSRIVINDMGSLLFALFFLSIEDRKRTIFILQGQDYVSFEKKSFILRIINYKLRFRVFFQQIDRILAVSEFAKEDFIKHTGLAEIRNKTNVVHNFYDQNLFNYRQLPTRQDIPRILTVTRIDQKKGLADVHDILIKLSENKLFHWTIIGSGKDELWFEKLVISSPIRERIEWIRGVQRSSLPDYYRMSDVFILLSEYCEAFGLVYIEASACGTPVIGRDRGGVREAIIQGKTGFLVQNSDEALQILNTKSYEHFDRSQVALHSKRYAADQVELLVENAFKRAHL